jgi:hypothetical protein
MRIDPSDKKLQNTKKSLLTFEDDDAEMWCKWREQLDEFYQLIPLTTAEQMAKAVVSLRSKVLALYTMHQSRIKREKNDPKAKGIA